MTRYLGRKATIRNQYLGHINLTPETILEVYRTNPPIPGSPFYLTYDDKTRRLRMSPGEEWAPLQDVLNGIGPIAQDIHKHFLFVIKENPF
jgi:hypothetical protein